jgi:hypothetical protein
MATLLDLVARNALFKIDPALDGAGQEFRCIYAAPRLKDWLQGDLLALESTWKIEATPAEQVAELVEHFCSGETLCYEWQFKPLTHIRDGVWELKTADIRIFGWFWKKDWFIGVAANPKDHIKRHNLYNGHTNEVERFRCALDLDEPKFVRGDNPHDVVSDFSYP